MEIYVVWTQPLLRPEYLEYEPKWFPQPLDSGCACVVRQHRCWMVCILTCTKLGENQNSTKQYFMKMYFVLILKGVSEETFAAKFSWHHFNSILVKRTQFTLLLFWEVLSKSFVYDVKEIICVTVKYFWLRFLIEIC